MDGKYAREKILNIVSHQERKYNHKYVPLHTHGSGQNFKNWHHPMCFEVKEPQISATLLAEAKWFPPL